MSPCAAFSRKSGPLFAIFFLTVQCFAQYDDQFAEQPWRWNASIDLSVANVHFSNWVAGGEYSYLLGLNSSLDPSWMNDTWSFESRWDGEYTVFKSKTVPLHKVLDRLDWTMRFGYRLTPTISLSLFGELQTQFWPGYGYFAQPNDDGSIGPIPYISNFMAPGYLTTGLGLEMKDDSLGLSVLITPLSMKQTYVLDKGVDPTTYGLDTGATVLRQPGAHSHIRFKKEIFSRTTLDIKTILFIDYSNTFAIDLSMRTEVDVKVLSYLKVFAAIQLLDDKDLKVSLYEDLDGDGRSDDFAGVGPRLQIFGQIGIALTLSF
jgi:hypothetical protein